MMGDGMLKNINFGLVDVVVSAVVILVAAVGGIVVAIGRSDLDFAGYVNILSDLMIGVGLYGIGRGVVAGARAYATTHGASEDEIRKL